MSGVNYLDREDVCDEVAKNFMMEKPKKTVIGNFRIVGDELRLTTEHLSRVGVYVEDYKKMLEQLAQIKKDIKSGVFVPSNGMTFEEIKKTAKKTRADKGYHARFHGRMFRTKVLAKKVGGVVFGNSSSLNIESNRRSLRHEVIQTALEKAGAAMIPFVVFEEAKLELKNMKVIARGPEETVTRWVRNEKKWEEEKKEHIETPVYEDVHFTGASLVECQGKRFLFDIDRNEIKHKRFNAFVVELPKDAKPRTIEAAYESLKPKEVSSALKKGLDVKRQGEWFFIPAPKSLTKRVKKMTQRDELIMLASSSYTSAQNMVSKKTLEMVKKEIVRIRETLPIPMQLKAGDNRPNNAEFGVKIGKVYLCRGKISHSGREHQDLILNGWHVAVPNTGTKSWQISGDID